MKILSVPSNIDEARKFFEAMYRRLSDQGFYPVLVQTKFGDTGGHADHFEVMAVRAGSGIQGGKLRAQTITPTGGNGKSAPKISAQSKLVLSETTQLIQIGEAGQFVLAHKP